MTRIHVATASLLTLLSAATAGCGSDTPTTKGARTHPGRRVIAVAAQRAVPATRADGHAWPSVPTELAATIPGDVLVARRATQAELAGVRCDDGPGPRNPTRRFLNATIDDFSLKATFRETVPRDAGGEMAGRPVVEDCSAFWDRSHERWRAVRCRHYAPAWTLNAVTYSGGGMLDYCHIAPGPRVPAGPHAVIWLVPPPGARWLVVRRGDRYSVAYPVHKREPVRVLYLLADAPRETHPRYGLGRVFRYDAVTGGHHVFHLSVHGYTAG